MVGAAKVGPLCLGDVVMFTGHDFCETSVCRVMVELEGQVWRKILGVSGAILRTYLFQRHRNFPSLPAHILLVH